MVDELSECDATQLMRKHSQGLEEAMAQHFVAEGLASSGESRGISKRLFDPLFLGDKEGATDGHYLAGIERAYLIVFGDALAPVLRDVLGVEASPLLVARCVDRYWTAIKSAISV